MRVLIAGLGGIGQRHARNLRAILGDDLELVAYRTRRLTRTITPSLQADVDRNVESDLGITVFSDLDAALDTCPDAAFICNPSSLHVPVAMSCVLRGCDLFVEKPLASSLEGVDALIEAAESSRRVAMVGYQLRFHPCIQMLSQILTSGELGKPLAVRAIVGEFLPGFHPYEDYRESYAANEALGGGVVLTQIHELDYLYALFGPVRAVYSLGGHWTDLEIDVEDVASTLMQASFGGRPLPIHVQQDYLQSPAVRRCEVVGEHGIAVAALDSKTVTVSRLGAERVQGFPTFDRNQMFVDELRHFLHCVETREKPLVDLRDGAASLRTALAIKESMARDTLVHLHDGGDYEHTRSV